MDEMEQLKEDAARWRKLVELGVEYVDARKSSPVFEVMVVGADFEMTDIATAIDQVIAGNIRQ